MIFTEQTVEAVMNPRARNEVYATIEVAARTCYRSFDKIEEGSAERLIESCIRRGHHSILEHISVTLFIVTSRGIMAELTRHRHNSFSIESTRYCNYRGGVEYVLSSKAKHMTIPQYKMYTKSLEAAEKAYLGLVNNGVSPQIARDVLPLALATRIITTANLRQWRTVIELRSDKAAHPDMVNLSNDILKILYKLYPIIFDDLAEKFLKSK